MHKNPYKGVLGTSDNPLRSRVGRKQSILAVTCAPVKDESSERNSFGEQIYFCNLNCAPYFSSLVGDRTARFSSFELKFAYLSQVIN